jgi:hypothetical protein
VLSLFSSSLALLSSCFPWDQSNCKTIWGRISYGCEPNICILDYDATIMFRRYNQPGEHLTMLKSDHKPALLAIEKVLMLLCSVQMLEGSDKNGVEYLLEMAVENLKN